MSALDRSLNGQPAVGARRLDQTMIENGSKQACRCLGFRATITLTAPGKTQTDQQFHAQHQ
jgi:hypothetical protein